MLANVRRRQRGEREMNGGLWRGGGVHVQSGALGISFCLDRE